MNALETIDRIIDSNLYEAGLKYCLVDKTKIPYKNPNELARPNKVEDFVNLSDLLQYDLSIYAGIGISVQASNVFAIDVDDCFKKEFDLNSADERAKDILDRFKNIAYCEFSFSGKGLRIFFRLSDTIQDYSTLYYIKNSKKQIEFYQPANSFRYVTVTGKYIYNNKIQTIDRELNVIKEFLNYYMLKPVKIKNETRINEELSVEKLMKKVKYLYLTNPIFQNLWFGKAPGSGKDESEKDFQLLAILFEHITNNKYKLKEIFEASPYFKSKDQKHINKWVLNDNRYFNYIYEHL